MLEAVGYDEVVISCQGREALLSHITIVADQPRIPFACQISEQRTEVAQAGAGERRDAHRRGGVLHIPVHGLLGGAHRHTDLHRGLGQCLPGAGQDKGPTLAFCQGHLDPAL